MQAAACFPAKPQRRSGLRFAIQTHCRLVSTAHWVRMNSGHISKNFPRLLIALSLPTRTAAYLTNLASMTKPSITWPIPSRIMWTPGSSTSSVDAVVRRRNTLPRSLNSLHHPSSASQKTAHAIACYPAWSPSRLIRIPCS